MTYDIVINGKAQSGKDTFIYTFTKLFSDKYQVHNISSIDDFRYLPTAFGWDQVKDERYRECMSLLKEALTTLNDYPLNSMLKKRDRIKSVEGKNKIIFYHIRESLEINKFLGYIPEAIKILIDRDVEDQGEFDYNTGFFPNEYYDYIIYNTGNLKELEDKVILWENTIG